MKAFRVNIDVVVRVNSNEGREAAEKEAMRVAPRLHRDELSTDKTYITYVEEIPCCPRCGGVDIKRECHITRGMRYECKSCGEMWSDDE